MAGKIKNKMDNKSKFSLKAKVLDIKARVSWIIVVNISDCEKIGIRPGDGLLMYLKGQSIGVFVDVTDALIKPGEVGIFEDLAGRFSISDGERIEFSLLGRPKSTLAIQKKLFKKKLTYEEIYSIISDIVSRRLNDVAVAFFIASSFLEEISKEELFYLTKAMVETGKELKFPGIVVDKHSVGGLCGNETTPIIVPIIASLGLYIPKTCSRAITSASGTADSFETIAPVAFSVEKLQEIVSETSGCVAWGANDIVPSDARIIEIASQFYIESFEKMVSSIMAKKVAMGIKYLVVDIPINKTAKITSIAEANKLKKIFEYLAGKFKMKIRVSMNKAKGPIGRGIGPAFQIRDDLMVLEQKENRPIDLENRAVELAGVILEMTGKAKRNKGKEMARQALKSGRGLAKAKEIIKAQGGDDSISSEKIKLGEAKFEVKAKKSGRVKSINNHHLVEICRILGAPFIKEAGIYLDKQVGEKVKKGETIFTMHTISSLRLELAKKKLKAISLYEI